EAFIHLPLVGSAVAKIGEAHIVVAAITVGKGKPASDRHLRADNSMAAIKLLFARKHMHRATLALRGAAAPARQFGHDGFGVHAESQHMAMIAVAGDCLIAFLCCHPDSRDDRLLAYVEMAEAADEAHSIHLPRFFFETANEQHGAQAKKLFLFGERG